VDQDAVSEAIVWTGKVEMAWTHRDDELAVAVRLLPEQLVPSTAPRA